MKAILVECTDYDTMYGILEVQEVSEEDVQDKIYEIKRQFVKDGVDDWTIEDVLENFPDEWMWEFDDCAGTVEI